MHGGRVGVGVSAMRLLASHRDVAVSQSVLIVEDCAPIAAILARHLASAGYRTLVAYDGKQALDLIALTPPDCILLDLMLPRVNGTEVLRALRQSPTTAAIPVVLVSAQMGPGGIHLGTELADESVGKPFTREQVLKAVRAAVEKKVAPLRSR